MVDGRDLALLRGLVAEASLERRRRPPARTYQAVVPMVLLVSGYVWLGVVPTVVAAVGIVTAILLFERRRAERIKQDLTRAPRQPHRGG